MTCSRIIGHRAIGLRVIGLALLGYWGGFISGCGQADPATTAGPVNVAPEKKDDHQSTSATGTAISPEIRELLNSEQPEQRVKAGKLLSLLLRENVQRRQTLSGSEQQTQTQVISQLLDHISQLGPQGSDSLPVLEEALKQNLPLELKQQILDVLDKLGIPAKRMGRTLARASQIPELQIKAIHLMIQWGCDDTPSVVALARTLSLPAYTNKVLHALEQMDERAVAPAAQGLLEVSANAQLDLTTRQLAIKIMGKFSHAGVPNLSPLWNDESPQIRAASMRLGISDAEFLIRESDPTVITAAFEGFAQPPIQPNYLAHIFGQAVKQEPLRPMIWTFLREHADAAPETLYRMSQSDSAFVREQATEHLATDQDADFLKSLEKFLEQDQVSSLQALAAIRLQRTPPKVDTDDFVLEIADWLQTAPLQQPALTLLKMLGPGAAPAIMVLVFDEQLDSRTKSRILDLLSQIPDVNTHISTILQRGLKAEEPVTQTWAAIASVRLSADDPAVLSPQVAPLLQGALSSTDAEITVITLEILSQQPHIGASLATAVIDTLGNTDPKVRLAAIRCLMKIQPAAKSPALLEALKKLAMEDQDEQVKLQATEAIQKIERKPE